MADPRTLGRRLALLLMTLVLHAAAGATDALAQAAQASIAGVVRDASGAVLPGVTVEASSPALIEKVRTVTTDGAGQYRIEQLRTGTYAVTFALTGFSTVKREGVELTGSFSATVNADLRVGALEETVTVTGASPIVDVQSATKQRVIDADVLAAIPNGRTQFTAATLIPGMNLNNQDVGGTNIINTTGGTMTIHGSNGNDQRVMIDGLSTANAELAGQASNFLPNMGSAQEVAVDFSSGTADQATGGVRINIIPREGGNQFTGGLFATGATSGFQADNYTDELQARGLRTPNSVKMNYDINPTVGGPLSRDKVWFYGAARFTKTQNYVGGMFHNVNEGIENIWLYQADFEPPRVHQRLPAQRQPASDLAGQPEEQVQLLHGRSGPLPVRERHRDDGAGGGDRDQVPGAAHDHLRLDLAAHQPAAARGARRHPARELQVQRDGRQRSAEAADHRHRAGLGQRRARQHAVSRRRHRRPDRHPAVPEHRRPQLRSAVLGLLHHRHARLQGRRQRHHRAARRVAGRQHLQRQLPLQQHHSEPDHGALDALQEGAAAARRHRPVRAGQVDRRSPDAQPRSPLRLPEDLHSGAAPRPGAAGPQPEPGSPRNRSGELEGPDAAAGSRLRPVRHRQDGAQDQHQQVRSGAGCAGPVRRRDRAGEPARELREPGVERPDVSGGGRAAQQLLPRTAT